MQRFARFPGGAITAKHIAIPAMLVLALTVLIVGLLFSWSTTRSDNVSFVRQEQLVSHVLRQGAIDTAREQESMTLKDAAVERLQGPLTEAALSQMDRNFGPFFYTYYGHDESYVLNGRDEPFYAMRQGRRVSPAAFATLQDAARPVVARLREATGALPRGAPLPNGSPWAHDILVVNGHPAILSVKPIISNSGRVYQPRGREMVQISVVYLDGRFINDLRNNYLFKNARFAWRLDGLGESGRSGEEALPFASPLTGRTIGYLVWEPYAPGSIVVKDMMPVLLLALLLVSGLVWLLIRRIQGGTARLQASEAQATHLAFHDVLTGLPNRALFNDRLDRALAAIRREPSRKLALLYIDLDRFKKVNDTLGHPAGDELIHEFGRRLTNTVSETDTVARLGGDEFAVILSDPQSDEDIDQLCERLFAVVEDPFTVVGSQVFVGMSIGVARSGTDGLDRVELTRKADIALYHAKMNGRGFRAIFNDSMDTTIKIRQAIEQDLRDALLAGDQLQVYYQLKYEAASKKPSGAEALVRWHHPRSGLVSPSVFVPIAEECGLIEQLGEWVLKEACVAAARWPIGTISVNVSPMQLRNPMLAARIMRILLIAGMQPHRLELEITETAFLESADQCEANLKALRAHGIRIALDDFGTGYSSFSHLRDYEVDRLKIDRSFTDAIHNSSDGSAIIRAIVDLARASGLKVTAEGVETAEQSEFLCAVGCDELQGFLMAKPVPGNDIDRLFGIESFQASVAA